MTSLATLSWSFAAVAGVNVQCPRALDGGIPRIVGKTHDEAQGAYVLGGPTTYAMSKREAAGLRAFFAKALRLGELAPADQATAEAFGVPFSPPATKAADRKEQVLWPLASEPFRSP